MLRQLAIRDIVLIEALDLDFRPGLNVLTGETGAGKSILLDALGFALGRKPRRDMVRAGAERASVTAVFELERGHPALRALEEFGIDGAEGELILRRVASQGGPARGFVNDQRTSAEALLAIGAHLVEVHGQHDDRGLLDPKAHGPLLDAFGTLGPEIAETAAAWSAAEATAKAAAEARARIAKAAEEVEYLRHALDELTKLAPEVGEAEALDRERRTIQAAARIAEDATKAAQAISGEGAEGLMGDALARLTRIADRAEGRLDAPIAALDRAMAELTEAQTSLGAALEAMAFEPGRLDLVEERLFALRALARKHQVDADALPDLAIDFARRLDEIDAGEDRLATLDAEAAEARAAYDAAAERLTEARRTAAERLDRLITAELAPLKMEHARFETVIAPRRPGPDGADRIAFTAQINPGAPAGPIDRIASGGELSRFLLAMKVCLAARAPGLSLIFDEIDRGVGGATADAVGRRLARLAEEAQVLVVTHSPQVAALGAHHWRIAKTTAAEVTRTDVALLNFHERLDEIARMLAGDEITAEARSAARALMEKAAS